MFWKEGNRILQNMQDMKQSGRSKLPSDPLECETTMKSCHSNDDRCTHIDSDGEDEVFDNAIGVEEYTHCEGFEYGEDLCQDVDIPRELDSVQKKQKIDSRKVIPPRANLDSSMLLHVDETASEDNTATELNEQSADANISESVRSEYSTILGFVSGCAVGNFQMEDSGIDHAHETFYKDKIHPNFINESDWLTLGFESNFDKDQIPTLKKVAEEVAREQGVVLDDLQYKAYEIICSSFLLTVVNEATIEQAI